MRLAPTRMRRELVAVVAATAQGDPLVALVDPRDVLQGVLVLREGAAGDPAQIDDGGGDRHVHVVVAVRGEEDGGVAAALVGGERGAGVATIREALERERDALNLEDHAADDRPGADDDAVDGGDHAVGDRSRAGAKAAQKERLDAGEGAGQEVVHADRGALGPAADREVDGPARPRGPGEQTAEPAEQGVREQAIEAQEGGAAVEAERPGTMPAHVSRVTPGHGGIHAGARR
jgi:hypothetical protein